MSIPVVLGKDVDEDVVQLVTGEDALEARLLVQLESIVHAPCCVAAVHHAAVRHCRGLHALLFHGVKHLQGAQTSAAGGGSKNSLNQGLLAEDPSFMATNPATFCMKECLLQLGHC